MVIEPEESTQSYIEDCEVCCHPIRIEFGLDDENEFWFKSDRS